MNIMIGPSARGGMKAVVDRYVADGFVAAHDVTLVSSYAEGGFAQRQVVLVRALARFLALLVRHRVRLVHIHAAMRGSFWRKAIFAETARLFGVPVLLHLHGSEMRTFYESQPRWARRLVAAQLARAACVVTLSESWQSFVRRVAPRARTTVLPNYVEMPERPSRGAAPGEPLTLLFLGLLGPRKGIYDLLEALASVRAECPPLRLVVGGNGEVEAARERAVALGLADIVRFEGWVGPARKGELLEGADVFLLPSYNEGLPMSVLEAMAYGIPVVTTDVGGLPELLADGVHGRMIRPGDREALGRAIRDLGADGAGRCAMGAAGRDRVRESYSREAVLPELGALYRTHARLAAH